MRSSLRHSLANPVSSWRTGTPESQRLTLGVLLALVAVSFVLSLTSYSLMPLTNYYLWLLLGMMLLRFRPLAWLTVLTVLAAIGGMVLSVPLEGARIAASVVLLLSAGLILFASSRQQSGLPQPIGEAMLADLRDRLRPQTSIAGLPEDWHVESAFVSAHGGRYSGDFMIARLTEDRSHLELILVDVAGKGVPAATRALQFGGALGGLVGALPPRGLVSAANDFLYRQDSDETFATAVHLLVDLQTGRYHLTNAGHPPVLVLADSSRRWNPHDSRGTALGVVPEPDIVTATGALAPGEALLLYTDGVVESRHADLDRGIAWLQQEAEEAVYEGFDGAARRILDHVESGEDDRAVLIVQRVAG